MSEQPRNLSVRNCVGLILYQTISEYTCTIHSTNVAKNSNKTHKGSLHALFQTITTWINNDYAVRLKLCSKNKNANTCCIILKKKNITISHLNIS